MLRELAKQVLVLALDSDNPQYKVDVLKAVQGYGKATAGKAAPAEPTSSMATWGAQLRQVQRAAEEVNGGDDEAETDRA